MKDKYINQYNLIEKGIVKDYWIMNVYIQDINNHKHFRYYNDKSITYNNGYLLQEVDMNTNTIIAKKNLFIFYYMFFKGANIALNCYHSEKKY